MWTIVPKKDQRKYKLLKYLFLKEEPVILKTLSEETDTSIRSLKYYFDELRPYIENLGGCIESSNEGILLTLPSSIGPDYFLKHVMKSVSGFQVLEKLFFCETLTKKDLEDTLFLSNSTLTRTLGSLSVELKHYGLTLYKTPLSIKGPEELLRRFYARYFLEAYEHGEWPFKEILKEFLIQLVEKLHPYCKDYQKLIKKRAFLMTLAVAVTRHQQGHKLPAVPEYERLLKELKKDFPSSIAYQFLDPSLFNACMEELTILKHQYSLLYQRHRYAKDPTLQKNLDELKNLYLDVARIFNLDNPSPWPQIHELEKILAFYERYTTTIHINHHLLEVDRDYILVKHFKVGYPYFYTYAKNRFLKILSRRNLPVSEELLEELLYTLISTWENLTALLFHQFNSVKILLYSHLSRSHSENMISSLRANVNILMEIEVYEETELSKTALRNYAFDLIISTTSIKEDFGVPIVYLHGREDGHVLSALQRTLTDILEKKRQQILQEMNQQLF